MHDDASTRFDRELSLRGLLLFAAGLIVGSVAVLWLSAVLYQRLLRESVAHDPKPPPIQERTTDPGPPSPRLQTAPESELRAMRHDDRVHLHSYGWVDREGGIAHIPIDRAVDIMLAEGQLSQKP